MQELCVLSEANVLRLIVRARCQRAEAFERWMFEEVLPSIRRTGSYSLPVRALTPAEAVQINRVEQGRMHQRKVH
ncbi:BRO family protein [Duganella sp. SG902]|uniref:BRO family protein n=1 Tax=Duganella sp. SG902 TaxID=2587016 RepID=UPI0035A60904